VWSWGRRRAKVVERVYPKVSKGNDADKFH
jgi:hypothetical protein